MKPRIWAGATIKVCWGKLEVEEVQGFCLGHGKFAISIRITNQRSGVGRLYLSLQ